MRSSRFAFFAVSLLLLLGRCAVAEEGQSTLGDGVILIAPMGERYVDLINAEKQSVHRWQCETSPGNATYLLEDGSLLRMGRVETNVFKARGGAGGRLQKISWDSEVLWDYYVASDKIMAHHDICPMPNGNVLVIAWEHHSRDEAIENGRDPRTLNDDSLWPETILELKPIGKNDAEVVWQWRLWDHLIQKFDSSKKNYGEFAEHPELVDINYGIRRGRADWIHMNSVDYNRGVGSGRSERALVSRDVGDRSLDVNSRSGGSFRWPLWKGRRPAVSLG